MTRAHVILGPPGTGKTSTLVQMSAERWSSDAGKGVLLVSHTRNAAAELRRRCGLTEAEVRTLHSFSFNRAGLIRQQVVSESMLERFGANIGVDFEGPDSVGTEALAVDELARAAGVEPEQAFAIRGSACPWPDCIYTIEHYRKWKQVYGLVDFTDMLETLVESTGDLGKWRAVVVDEAQDMTPLQWRLLDRIVAGCPEIVVAGDDDQAIYAWGGADPAGMAKFSDQYGAKQTVLRQSHRIPAQVHTLAERVVARIADRLPKKYEPREEQGSVNHAGDFEQLSARDLDGCTVLYRDKSQRDNIDEHLQALGMRYTSVREPYSPYDSREARSLRTLDHLRRGETVTEHAMTRLRASLAPEALWELDCKGPAAIWDRDIYFLFEWRDHVVLDYLSSVDVCGPVQVQLSTIHGLKGGEADKVVLCLGMSERVMRGFMAEPDQEHRVFYVGITRARSELVTAGGANEYPI